MKKILLKQHGTTSPALTGLVLGGMIGLAVASTAIAAEDWKASFEDICSKVDASQAMSAKELEALMEKADRLAPEIQKSEDPTKKVYLKRLKNCRSMYEFMLESKKAPAK